jgi:hypothetical protein
MKKYNYLLIVTIIALLNFKVEAQIQLDSVSYYYKNNNYKKSINLSLILENEFNVKADTLNKDYTDVLTYQGLSFLKESEYVKAEKCLLRALKLNEIIFTKKTKWYTQKNIQNLFTAKN